MIHQNATIMATTLSNFTNQLQHHPQDQPTINTESLKRPREQSPAKAHSETPDTEPSTPTPHYSNQQYIDIQRSFNFDQYDTSMEEFTPSTPTHSPSMSPPTSPIDNPGAILDTSMEEFNPTTPPYSPSASPPLNSPRANISNMTTDLPLDTSYQTILGIEDENIPPRK